MKPKNEYDKFDRLARGVLSVPHNEIKKKLDEEKQAKKRKKSKQKAPGAKHDARA